MTALVKSFAGSVARELTPPLCRWYFTILASIWFGASARSWTVAAYAVLVGLLIDLVRWRFPLKPGFVPDTAPAYWFGVPMYGSDKIISAYLLVGMGAPFLPVIYAWCILRYAPQLGEAPWLALDSDVGRPIYRVLADLFASFRHNWRFLTGLYNLPASRLAIIFHLNAVSLIWSVFCVAILCPAMLRAVAAAYTERDVARIKTVDLQPTKAIRVFVLISALTLFVSLTYEAILIPGRKYGYYPQQSDGEIVRYAFTWALLTYLQCFAYLAVALMHLKYEMQSADL